MIGYVIVFVVGVIIGAVGLALVYRNNKKKVEKVIDDVVDIVDKE
jgi:uncharacterized membrane-anchored protein YhcB (DUF1043 family)